MSKKNTKRALIMSVISLLACVSMLVGSTFAWFTDSVTSANNIIKSGNLDIELEYWDGDEWVDVSGKSDILTNTLFEPGVVEVAYLRIANAGSLALKYQLGINIISEVPGVNAAGKEFKLSDYIRFAVVEDVNGETGAYADRDAAVADVIGNQNTIADGYTKTYTMVAGAEKYVALVVGMPTSVGNEANHDGVNIPQIDLGINIYATQYTYEADSFGIGYDKNSPWVGYVDTAWYDANATEYTLTAAEELAGLAKLVNEGNTFKDKTIKLGANIDLNNLPWTPIGSDLSKCFSGTFDGAGYTISNLNVEGVNNVGLFGYAAYGGNVKNLTVKGATAKGNDYVGVIMGRGYTDIDNCRVENATVISTPYLKDGIYDGGAKAGGIIGQIMEGANNTVTNCSVDNVKICGFRDIGGVVGMVHNNNSCSGNTATNVALAYVLCPEITADKNENAGAIYGRVQASATVSPAKDSAENQAYTLGYVVSTAAELKAALANGGEITLEGDIAIAKNETITIPNGKSAVIDLNGYEISGTADKTGNQELFLVKGNLTVVNGALGYTASNNQGWGAMIAIFDVTAGGVLNLDGVTASVGGSDMNFIVHLNNWGSATLNVKNCDFTASYVAIRAFNSGNDMNNIVVENTKFHGGRVFWVHNYTAEGKGNATLNVSIYGNGNTTDNAAPIRYGFNDSLYFDINGNAL